MEFGSVAGAVSADMSQSVIQMVVARDESPIVFAVFLPAEFQNHGVGQALLGSLIDEAKQSGKPLRHMVFVLNNDAHRFYERLGFVIIEDLGAYKHMEWSGPSQNRLR